MRKIFAFMVALCMICGINIAAFAEETQTKKTLLELFDEQTSDELRATLSDESTYHEDSYDILNSYDYETVTIVPIFNGDPARVYDIPFDEMLQLYNADDAYRKTYMLIDDNSMAYISIPLEAQKYGETKLTHMSTWPYPENEMPFITDLRNSTVTKVLSGEERQITNVYYFGKMVDYHMIYVFYETTDGIFIQYYDTIETVTPVDMTYEEYLEWGAVYEAYLNWLYQYDENGIPTRVASGPTLGELMEQYETPENYYAAAAERERTENIKSFFQNYGVFMIVCVVLVTIGIAVILVRKKKKANRV